jgi:hypothetical protein
VDALKQGIFDQKSWDTKEFEKAKPNPAFRIRWGPGDTLIHRPIVRNRTLDEGTISFTKLHLSAIENVISFTICIDDRMLQRNKHRDYWNVNLSIQHLVRTAQEFLLQRPHQPSNFTHSATRHPSTQAQFDPSTNTKHISGI